MSNSITATEAPLAEIFNGNMLFNIPPYQRPYSWENEQIEELFSDLLMASDSVLKADKLKSSAPYFLGSIVLVAAEHKTFDVIDGQQRLTTITLLLSALKELAENSEANGLKKNVVSLLKQEANELTGDPCEYRLTVREEDSEFFRDTIIDGERNDPPQTDSQKRMLENKAALKSRLTALDESRRKLMFQYIMQKCILVIVTATDRDAAYRIFSVMNDRGMNLTTTDILKAEIIGAISGKADQNRYTKKWVKREDELGRESFEQLFAHIRMIARKRKSQVSLVEEYKTHIKPTKNPEKFIDTVLIPTATSYQQILNSYYPETDQNHEINRSLQSLSLISNNDWQPVAIRILQRFDGQADKIANYLHYLERYSFFLLAQRSYETERIRRYGKCLENLDSDDVKDAAEIFGLTTSEQIDFIGVLDSDIYNHSKFCRALLLHLDAKCSSGSATYEFKTFSIEHIYPQTIKTGSPWENFFGNDVNEEDRYEWTHSLGNLVPLNRRKNSRAQNFTFEVKKSEYFRVDNGTPFVLTGGLANVQEWNFSELDKRHEKYIDILINDWSLESASEIYYAGT